jgi:hypothetical protein
LVLQKANLRSGSWIGGLLAKHCLKDTDYCLFVMTYSQNSLEQTTIKTAAAEQCLNTLS